MMNTEFAIEARGLSKDFGALRAVDGLDLDVPRGEIYGFLGPNGSGKSTTIRMLCGLLTPSEGSATVLGVSVPGKTQSLKPRIGYMTQRFSLFGDMTVLENLQFISEIYSFPRRDRARRIEELLDNYQLQQQRRQLAGTMSGGQKQRLGLACAVLHRPELLLLDEPTSAVDPQSRRDFWANLFRLAEGGTTIMVSTHYMDEAERCHRLAILDRGRVAAEGVPRRLARDIDAVVLEVECRSLPAARRRLAGAGWVRSVTQLGSRLHVLVGRDEPDPAERLRALVAADCPDAAVERVPATLEDVFVAATGFSAPAARDPVGEAA